MAVKDLTLQIIPLKVLQWDAMPAVHMTERSMHLFDFAAYLEEGFTEVDYGVEFNDRSDGSGAVTEGFSGAFNGRVITFSSPAVSGESTFYFRLTAQEVAHNHATNIYYSAWTPIIVRDAIFAFAFNNMVFSFNGKAFVFHP